MATTVAIACPSCSKETMAPTKFLGQKVKCNKCGERFEAAPRRDFLDELDDIDEPGVDVPTQDESSRGVVPAKKAKLSTTLDRAAVATLYHVIPAVALAWAALNGLAMVGLISRSSEAKSALALGIAERQMEMAAIAMFKGIAVAAFSRVFASVIRSKATT